MKLFRLCPLLLAVVLLAGCSLFDGQYIRVTPHEMQSSKSQEEAQTVDNYTDLRQALVDMVAAGRENMVLYVQDYRESALQDNMEGAKTYLCGYDPVGSYAVEDLTYEIGAKGGMTAVAVAVTYRHSQSDIRNITHLDGMDTLEETVLKSLEDIDFRKVMLVPNYIPTDFSQMVQNLSQSYPQTVMECPQVTADVYGKGTTRLVELTFTYENGRDALKQMRGQVGNVFNAAALYVSGEGSDLQKYSQLYSFLMDRFTYTMDSSITPAYSLLRHGVGDSRAFANVYGAMCRSAGLECMTVTGTRNGEPWTWNMICDTGRYYHLDLTRCKEDTGFCERTDDSMTGYVWDYSAFPKSVGEIVKEP